MTALLARWMENLTCGPQARISDSPQNQGSWEWVDNNIVPGILVCSSRLINVCMFIVRTGGAIWLNPFANVCSAITVVLFLYPCSMGVIGMFAVM